MITKAQLPNIPHSTQHNGYSVENHRPTLLCPSCHAEASATPGDYFMMADTDTFECPDCNEPMVLASRREVFVPWEVDGELTKFIEAAWNSYPESDE